MPFQTAVNTYNPPAVEGDFASANPRASVLAQGDGGLIAGPNGVTVGQFAWVSAVDGLTVNNYPVSANDLIGYVHRDQQALITNFLGQASNVIPEGFPVTLMAEGEFFDLVTGAAAATPGAKCYAVYGTGALVIGAAPTGASATGSIGASFTGVIAVTTGVLTASAVTGFLAPGDTISGSGVPAGTTIVSQLSGTAGGAGTYQTSIITAVASTAMTSFGNTLDVTAVSSGTLQVGDAITGTGIPANATITAQLSGTTGGAGTYSISIPASAYAASTAVTVVAGVLTNFVALTTTPVGQLAKISTWGN